MPSQGHLGARAISRLPQSFFREIHPPPPAPALIHKSPPSNLLHAASPYSQLPSGAFKQVNKSNSPNIEVSSSLASSWHSPFAAEPLLKLERFKIASLASNPRAGR
jgi:hypothetical protein